MLFVFSVLSCSLALLYPVYAADSIGFESHQFSSSKIFQGASVVYVDLLITNNSNSSLIVHGAFVHFDWQASNESFMTGSQRSGDPYDLGKELEPAENYTIRLPFSVPLTVSEGGHLYYFKVFYDDGFEDQWNPRADDPYAELIIYSAYEQTYRSRIDDTEDKIAQAQEAGFISPEARSLLQRAEENLGSAHLYAGQKDWQKAQSYLISASSYIDQAYAAEQRFQIYLIIGAVIGAGAVIGGVLLVRRKRRSSKKTTKPS